MCEQQRKDRAEWDQLVMIKKKDRRYYLKEQRQQCRGVMSKFYFGQKAAAAPDDDLQKSYKSAQFNDLCPSGVQPQYCIGAEHLAGDLQKCIENFSEKFSFNDNSPCGEKEEDKDEEESRNSTEVGDEA